MFHVGDRVRYKGPHYFRGYEGTVVCDDSGRIGVCFDSPMSGHSLDGRCAMGHGFWTFGGNLEPVEDTAFSPAPEAEFLSAITC